MTRQMVRCDIRGPCARVRRACPARFAPCLRGRRHPPRARDGGAWREGCHLGVEEAAFERPVDEHEREVLEDLGSGRHEGPHRASTHWLLVPIL